MAEKVMVTLAESGHPVFRATSPLCKEVLLDCDDRARKDLLLQQYGERTQKVITTRQIEQIFVWTQDS